MILMFIGIFTGIGICIFVIEYKRYKGIADTIAKAAYEDVDCEVGDDHCIYYIVSERYSIQYTNLHLIKFRRRKSTELKVSDVNGDELTNNPLYIKRLKHFAKIRCKQFLTNKMKEDSNNIHLRRELTFL